MPRRLLLSLLAIPALALVLAISCTRSRSDEPATTVIPPATPYVAPATARAPDGARDGAAADEPPSPEEVKEFERPVLK